jgi:hypothetical protein
VDRPGPGEGGSQMQQCDIRRVAVIGAGTMVDLLALRGILDR